MTKHVKLTFRRQPDEDGGSSIVLLQQAAGFEEMEVDWKVIEHCDRASEQPFIYRLGRRLSIIDAWSGVSDPHGDVFGIAINSCRDDIYFSEQECGALEIGVRNELGQGEVSAVLYQDGRPLALMSGIAPGETAVFAV